MPGYDGSVRIDSRIDSKGFNAGIKGMTASVGKLAAAVGIAFGVGAVINFGRTAVQAASQLASAMTGLQSIMDGQGKSFAVAQKFITDYTKDGLVPATNAIVAYKNLALAGYDTSQIETVMNALKDSAAFGRTASYTMGEAIQMATEGIKNENSILVDNAGVTKNLSLMWKDYAASIGTSVTSLTKQQKVLAIVNGMLEETKYQTGDAAKLTSGYAGMVAGLSTSFLNFKVAMGNAIMPVLMQIIPYIKAVIDWFVVLFNTVARVLNLFFGTNETMASIEDSSAAVADNTGVAADAAGDLADNTDAAGKAAKGALAAFDELNVLQMDDGGGGGAETPGVTVPAVTVGDDGEAADLIPDEWAAQIAAFKVALMDLLQPATEAFDRLVVALTPLGMTIWAGLVWAWENLIVPMGEWTLKDAVPAFLDLLGAAGMVLNEVLLALKPLGLWLWEEFLQPMAEWTGQAIIDALGFITDALYAFSDWISEHQSLVETFVILWGSFALAAWAVNGAIAVWNVIGAIATTVTTAFAGAVALVTSPVFLVILAIAALIAIIFLLIRNWDWVKAKAKEVWESIVSQWNTLSDNFKNNVSDPIKETFRVMWEDIKKFFSGAWDKIVEVWGKVSTWFTTNVSDPLKTGFATFLEWLPKEWEKVWTGIGEFVKGIVNGIIDGINGLLGGLAVGINGIIDMANKVGSILPDWTMLAHVTAPQIPRLATGGVIPPNAEFLAVLGDQRSGRNIEAPEALIRQIIREEAGATQPDIKVSFDGTLGALVRELKPHIDRENTRVGRSLISGGVA